MATLPPPAQDTSDQPDQTLSALVSSGAPTSIAGVLAQMQAIDELLPDNDGLKWFNRLYLMVTQQVDMNPPGGAWQNPAWLIHLDVVFAGLYFSAIRNYLSGADAPLAWAALFQSRYDSRIEHIQFALAGMNAHINHDLALAVLQTNSDLNILPAPDGPEHADYFAINTLLDTVSPTAMAMLANDPLGEAAEDTGKVGRLLAAFDIREARAAAWDFACQLRDLPGVARDAALAAQDVTTGALSRALLTAL
jgi:hypothetical protein